MVKFNILLDAARVHKLRFERRARNARDWLTYDESKAATFLDKLTLEMMEASAMISLESFRLAVTAMGLDFDSLHQTAKEKRGEALANLQDKLKRESVVLVDLKWDAQEQEDWLKKVSEETEKEAMCLDLKDLTLSPSPVPEPCGIYRFTS